METPSEYQAGLAQARGLNAALAEKYVSHTMVGDPLADALIEALADSPQPEAQKWIQLGIEQGPERLMQAPAAVRDFFNQTEEPPSWFQSAATRPGCRAFHRNSQMFIGAFVAAVLIEGFSTLISKSFCITGRLVDQGVRRLKQNNRHLVEIFLPGGLDKRADGWKLSVRIRLIHARVRFLLARSEDWDTRAWGTPLSAAHIALATCAFSALLLKRARMLGVELSAEEVDSFMGIWRYSGHLMGVAPELLFSNETEALQFYEIGKTCEPPPDTESCLLANGLINSAPIVAGITNPTERRKLARKIYQISRALIGNDLANQLQFPPAHTFGVLQLLRWQNKSRQFFHRMFPALARRNRSGQFQQMLEVSFYADEGIAYRMPGHVHAEKDSQL